MWRVDYFLFYGHSHLLLWFCIFAGIFLSNIFVLCEVCLWRRKEQWYLQFSFLTFIPMPGLRDSHAMTVPVCSHQQKVSSLITQSLFWWFYLSSIKWSLFWRIRAQLSLHHRPWNGESPGGFLSHHDLELAEALLDQFHLETKLVWRSWWIL